jgi:HK97 family phage prohead protease
MANPVVLYAHNSRELPIGHAELVEVRDGKLQIRVKFASAKANPRAEEVWNLIKERMLRAVSVGFVPRTIRSEKRDEKDIYVLTDNELHEVSVVPIPANPEALAKMKAKAIAVAGEAALPATQNAASSSMETAMADESKAALEAKERELAAAHKTITERSAEVTAARNEKTALEAQLATVKLESAAHLDRAKRAEADLCAREVDELVGRKIAPSEKAGLLELAALNRDLFARQIAAIKERSDMKLLDPVVGRDANTNHALNAGADDEIVALMNS